MLGHLALSAALTILSAAEIEPTLSDFAWEKRPILVFSPADDPRLAAQLDAFRDGAAALVDRDNVVIVDTGVESGLRRVYRPEGFTVILVGKDGGEKLRRRRVVAVEELNALIDTMPMRRNEMHRAGGEEPS